jgi:hypothetical protein
VLALPDHLGEALGFALDGIKGFDAFGHFIVAAGAESHRIGDFVLTSDYNSCFVVDRDLVQLHQPRRLDDEIDACVAMATSLIDIYAGHVRLTVKCEKRCYESPFSTVLLLSYGEFKIVRLVQYSNPGSLI